MKKIYGRIYKLTNKLNNKSYIGLTTKSIEERFQAHLDKANKEKSAVQKAMIKYGKENFEIVEIDIASSKDELYEKERYWICHYDTFNGYGYNLTNGGGGITDMSQEIRDKISKSKKGVHNFKLKGRTITRKQRLQNSRTLGGKRVRMYNPYTGHEIILEWVNQAREHGFNPSNVVSVCKGKRKHTKNYICEYIEESDHANPDLPTENKSSVAVQSIDGETSEKKMNNPSTRSRLPNKG